MIAIDGKPPTKFYPGTDIPDLRVENPPPPKDGPGAGLTIRHPGESPSKQCLPDELIGVPRAVIRGVLKPTPPPAA